MSDEHNGIEEMDLGVQGDGEPAVATTEAETKTETETKVETETTTEEKTEGGEAKTEETTDQPHKKTGSQRARERAEREAALRVQAERERDELKAKLEGLNKPTVEDPAAPTLDDDDVETVEDLRQKAIQYGIEKGIKEAEARLKAEQQRREFEAKQVSWKEADAKFSATKPDWDDAIEDLQEVVQTLTPQNAPGFGALDAALSGSEIAPALKYHLGKNPEEFRRMASLDPIKAVKELARLEIRIAEPKQPTETKPTSKAPPPAKPLATSSAVASDARYGGIEEY